MTKAGAASKITMSHGGAVTRGCDIPPKLIVRSPGAPRQEVWLEKPTTTLGRHPDCDVTLDAKYISRVHARIERSAGNRFMLVDEGSTNGSFVNGRRVAGSQLLEPGDHIGLADVSITFLDSPSTDATLTAPAPGRGPIRCDESTRQVWINGAQLDTRLSIQEFQLLLLLSAQSGRVFPRDELAMAIWGEGRYDYNMLHRLVHRLKQKLGSHREMLRSVGGVGYILGDSTEG